jgi:chain length determinant protein tyrosine kinase EpsG
MLIENIAQAKTGQATGKDSTIGRMLLDMGKITPEDASRVLALQATKGLRFGQAAQELGLVSEADIQLVLASQFDYQYVQSHQAALDPALVAAMDPFGKEAEMLRALRGQLTVRWFSAHKSLAVIAIDEQASAAVAAANLAIVFAQQGQRTLLVDANMRTPRQQSLFKADTRTGLSDTLAGRVQDASPVKVAPFDKLSLLCAGPQPPNPHELLGRPRFATLAEDFAQSFDIVLYDAPAMSTSADAYAVASRAGGVLLVLSKSATRQAEVREIRAQLLRSGVEIVGAVLLDF